MCKKTLLLFFSCALWAIPSRVPAENRPDAPPPPPQKPAAAAAPSVELAGAQPETAIDDLKLDRDMNIIVQGMVVRGDTFDKPDLEKVLNRADPLRLAPAALQSAPLDGPELYRRASRATVALYSVSAADARNHKGARLSAAFFVHPSGIAAASYHAIRYGEPFAVSAATSSGRVLKVPEILAIYPRQDLAFLRITGLGDAVDCLPLRRGAPAGMRVHALGHPVSWHFYIVEGTLARYGLKRDSDKTGAVMPARMNLSIDSGIGFSGGPVLDDSGNVLGMIDSMSETMMTRSTYRVHSAIPAGDILAHFTQEYHETLNEAELRHAFPPPATEPERKDSGNAPVNKSR